MEERRAERAKFILVKFCLFKSILKVIIVVSDKEKCMHADENINHYSYESNVHKPETCNL